MLKKFYKEQKEVLEIKNMLARRREGGKRNSVECWKI